MHTQKALTLMSALILVACAAKPVPDSEKPGTVVAGLAAISATVDAIDRDTRLVTLRGETGRTVTVKVDDIARNFEQINVGDRVDVEYYESVALYVRSGVADDPDVGGATAVGIAGEGQKPGISAVETVVMTAKVRHISIPRRLIEIERPDGTTETLRISKHVEDFDKVRAGDEIVVRHTMAVAIEVRPALKFE